MLPVASLRLPAKALLARVCSRAVVANVQQSRSYSHKPSNSVRVASSCVHGKSNGVAIPLWSSVPPTSTGACGVRGLHVSVSVAAKKGKKQKGGKGKNKGGGGGGGGDAGMYTSAVAHHRPWRGWQPARLTRPNQHTRRR